MYAVIMTGGKQYRVSIGEKIRIESVKAGVGEELILGSILAVGEGEGVTVGAPFVSNAAVKARVLSHQRGKKVQIFKLRRRKHYQKHQGHRQNFTEIEITGISV
jgi:large subunit ribosomal protein L21